MNRPWDVDVPPVETWKQLLRVLKPGAFCLVMCSPRQDVLAKTIYRLMDAKFNIATSSIYWVYAEGSAKSGSLEKKLGKEFHGCYPHSNIALKPAIEIVVVATKSIEHSTISEQAKDNRKGMIRVEPCRLPWAEGEKPTVGGRASHKMTFGGQEEGGWKVRDPKPKKIPYGKTSMFRSEIYNNKAKDKGAVYEINPKGRFPANLLISDSSLGEFSRFYDLDAWFGRRLLRLPKEVRETFPFLYVSKPTKKEKEKSLESFIPKKINDGRKAIADGPAQRGETLRKNTHETVKPLSLMMWLIELTSDPGDIVLDIHNGSGTTTLAAKLCDRIGIGCEIDPDYHSIAKARMDGDRTRRKIDRWI